MAKVSIKIVGDTNDADYVTQISTISEKDLQKFEPIIEAIKAFQPYQGASKDGYKSSHRHNFPHGDGQYIPREDLGEKSAEDLYGSVVKPGVFDEFLELVPFGEYGIHTITSIEVAPLITWKKLL